MRRSDRRRKRRIMQLTKPPRTQVRQRTQALDVFFSPKSGAVLGATENPGGVGLTVLWTLSTRRFGGTVCPVNPKRPSVVGVPAYPSLGELREPVDLAGIVTRPPSVPGIIRECGD